MAAFLDGFVDIREVRAEACDGIQDAFSVWAVLTYISLTGVCIFRFSTSSLTVWVVDVLDRLAVISTHVIRLSRLSIKGINGFGNTGLCCRHGYIAMLEQQGSTLEGIHL